jgi:hypothetical protein
VLFLAVQDKLAVQAVARRCRLRGSSALLTGRIFDERGNRMSPTHANKGGVRYRYYASQAVLQKKPQAPRSVSRVPAAELALELAALRNQLNGSQQLPDRDHELVERHVERVTWRRTGSSFVCGRSSRIPRKLSLPTTLQAIRPGISLGTRGMQLSETQSHLPSWCQGIRSPKSDHEHRLSPSGQQ